MQALALTIPMSLLACVPFSEPTAQPPLEFVDVSDANEAWYRTYLVELERRLPALPPLVIYGYGHGACEAPYCQDDDTRIVACSPASGDCIPSVATAIVDTLKLPRAFRDGLIEVLAGGIAHGDAVDLEIDRGVDVWSMLDDGVYLEHRRGVSDLVWHVRTAWPIADLVRFIVDELGWDDGLQLLQDADQEEAWEIVGGFDNAVSRWRALPPRRGRGFRLPLVECASAGSAVIGDQLVEAHIPSLMFAPDLAADAWMIRTAITGFVLGEDTNVEVTVRSGVSGNPFFRTEGCDVDAARFVRTRNQAVDHVVTGQALLGRGRYFIVAGSDSGGDGIAGTPPESIGIHFREEFP